MHTASGQSSGNQTTKYRHGHHTKDGKSHHRTILEGATEEMTETAETTRLGNLIYDVENNALKIYKQPRSGLAQEV